jgi:ribonuclease-3 family protein
MEDIKNYTGIVLAYIGDAVYELEVRRALIEKGYFRGNRLHKEAIRRVNAPVQSRLMMSIINQLSPEEMDAFRRDVTTNKIHSKQSSIKNIQMPRVCSFDGISLFVEKPSVSER